MPLFTTYLSASENLVVTGSVEIKLDDNASSPMFITSADDKSYLTFSTTDGQEAVQVGATAAGGANLQIMDDTKLYFGDQAESSIEYNENGNNRLTISGSASGIDITGSTHFASGSNVVVEDDSKLYFGTSLDAYISYDENFGAGTDELVFSGAAGGVDFRLPVQTDDAFTFFWRRRRCRF